MKKMYVLMGCLLSGSLGFSQNIGIGTSTPNPSAKVEIKDNQRGLLIPQVALTDVNSFTPLAGNAAQSNSLLVFNTATATGVTPGYYYWNTVKWVRLQDDTTGFSALPGFWSIQGNSFIDTAINFLGTIDSADLRFRVANYNAGKLGVEGDVFLGVYAGLNSYNNRGRNTGVGSAALRNNQYGEENVAVGYIALAKNQFGSNNTAVGHSSLWENTSGASNTATGFWSLGYNINGSSNTASGDRALLWNKYGSFNTAAGAHALFFTNGSGNSAVGNESLKYLSQGNANTAIGHLSGPVGPYVTVVMDNSSAIGAYANVSMSNKMRFGGSGVTILEAPAPLSVVSDARFKTNITPTVQGLDFIRLLKPVQYNMDAEKMERFMTRHMPDSSRNKRLLEQDLKPASAIVRTGFLAQDVEAAAKQCGFDASDLVHKPVNENDYYSVAYSQFVMPLVKSTQELLAMVEAQATTIKKHEQEMQQMRLKMEEMQKKTKQNN